jgi:hypothetical protein
MLQCVQVTDAPAAIVRPSVRPSKNVRVTTLPALCHNSAVGLLLRFVIRILVLNRAFVAGLEGTLVTFAAWSPGKSEARVHFEAPQRKR